MEAMTTKQTTVRECQLMPIADWLYDCMAGYVLGKFDPWTLADEWIDAVLGDPTPRCDHDYDDEVCECDEVGVADLAERIREHIAASRTEAEAEAVDLEASGITTETLETEQADFLLRSKRLGYSSPVGAAVYELAIKSRRRCGVEAKGIDVIGAVPGANA